MVNGKKAAIIGFGGMGQRHLKAYRALGIEVAAICDFLPDKVKSVMPDLSQDHIYTDFRALLTKEKIDVVSVATNAPSHAEAVIEAAERGINNIVCEKPIATNLGDAMKMVEACRKNGVALAVNHISRWSDNQRQMKSLIRQKVVGDIRHVYFHCGSVGLGNQGTHAFDKMRYFIESEPEWVIGCIDKTGTPNVRGPQFSDPGGFGMVHFRNGARAFIDTSEDTGVPYIIELVGTYGKIVINEYHNEWKVFARSEEDKKRPITYYIAPLLERPFELKARFDIVQLTASAIKELLSGAPPSCTGEDGMKALEMTIAFHVSDKENNHKIMLPLEQKYLSTTVNFA